MKIYFTNLYKAIALLFAVFMCSLSSVVASGQQSPETSYLYVRLKKNSSTDILLHQVKKNNVTHLVEQIRVLSGSGSSRQLQKSASGALLSISAKNAVAAENLVQHFSAMAEVEYVERGAVYQTYSRPNDPLYGTLQRYLERLDAENAWSALPAGTNTVTVAVIDNGVAWSHEDLTDNIYRNTNEQSNGQDNDNNGKAADIRGWDFVGNITAMEGLLGLFREDNEVLNISSSHGTQVASVIGAVANNNKGMAGVGRRIRILPIKIGSDNPNNPLLYRLPDAILYAIQQGADVICISGGRRADQKFGTQLKVEQEVIAEALAAGIVVIAAAGNEGVESTDFVYPASLPGVLAVAGAGQDDYRSPGSNFGRYANLYAPSEQILGAVLNNGYESFSGTSAAAALTAGAAALLKIAEPQWSATQIIQQLRLSSEVIGGKRTPEYYGRLHFGNALRVNRAGGEQIPALTFANPIEQFRLLKTIVTADGLPNPPQPIARIEDNSVHLVEIRLRNYFATAANVRVELTPIGDSSVVQLTEQYQPFLKDEWRSNAIETVQFPVQPNPRTYDREPGELYQEFLLTIAAEGGYRSYERLIVRSAPDNNGRQVIFVSPRTSLTAENPTAQVQIRNTGSEIVTLHTISLEGDTSAIRLTAQPTLPLTLAPGGVTELQASIVSNVPDNYELSVLATISIEDDGIERGEDEPPQDTSFTARGVVVGTVPGADIRCSATNVRFSTVRIGQSSSATIVVSNSGKSEIEPTVSIQGGTTLDAATYRVEGLPASLAAGESATITIIFTPQTVGQQRATIRIADADETSEASLIVEGTATPSILASPVIEANGVVITEGSFYAIAPVRVGESRTVGGLFLVNTGTSPIAIAGLTLSGTGSDECVITQPTGNFSIPAGGRVEVRLSVRPTRSGEKKMQLRIASPTAVNVPVILRGGRPIAADIALRPENEIFADRELPFFLGFVNNAAVGKTATGYLFLRNATNSPIVIASAVFSGANATEFRLLNRTFPLTLAPNATDTIDVEFSPQAEGVRQARLTISYNGTTGQDILDYQAFGFGNRLLLPAVFVPGDEGLVGVETENLLQIFPETLIGKTTQVFERLGLLNQGSTTENVAATIVGPDRSEFAITSGSGPFEVFPDGGIDFQVSFIPTSAGIKQARLRVQSQSGTIQEFSLRGRAVPLPELSASAQSIDFGEADIVDFHVLPVVIQGANLQGAITLQITNSSFFGMRLQADGNPEEDKDFILLEDRGDSLQSDTIYIVFNPITVGDYTTGLRITTIEGNTLFLDITGIGRFPTRPRIFTGTEVYFGSVEVRSTPFLSTLQFSAYALEEDITIETSDHFYIYQTGEVFVKQLTIAKADVIEDSIITLAFRPDNVLGRVPGTATLRSGNEVVTVSLESAEARPRQGMLAEQELTVTPTLVGETTSSSLFVVGSFLQFNSEIEVVVEGSDALSLEYNGVRYGNGERFTIPAGNGVSVRPSITLHFSPTAEGEEFGAITYSALRADGLESVEITLVRATGFLPPEFTTSHEEIRYGRVKLFTSEPFFFAVEGVRLADTLRIELQEKQTTFSFAVNDIELLQEYTLPLNDRSVNTDIVVFAEPTDYGFYNDTLILTTGEIVRRIPINAIGADTTTSVQEGQPISVVRVFPSIATERIVVVAEQVQPSTNTVLHIIDVLGNEVFHQKGLIPDENGTLRADIVLQNLPNGMYFIRLSSMGKEYINNAKFIIQR